MKILRSDLDQAVSEGIVTETQAARLWSFIETRQDDSRFNLSNVIYYLGGLIVISSMSWFMVTAWEQLGGPGIFFTSIAYGIGLFFAAKHLWFALGLRIPGGILFTAAVWMTPLAVYGFERWMGWWPQGDPGTYRDYHVYIKGSWIFMEIATIVVGLGMLRYVQFPFLTFPIAFALWYMSMDLTPLLFGRHEFDWEDKKLVSIGFGFLMLVVTYFVDRRRLKHDYAFWGYLFGLAAFWGGLSMMSSNSELNKFIYCCLNLGLIFLSVFLSRRVFAVFGAIGVFGYLGHLAESVFKDALLFPLVMSFIGLGVIWIGVRYQKNQREIDARVLGWIPESWLKLRPLDRG